MCYARSAQIWLCKQLSICYLCHRISYLWVCNIQSHLTTAKIIYPFSKNILLFIELLIKFMSILWKQFYYFLFSWIYIIIKYFYRKKFSDFILVFEANNLTSLFFFWFSSEWIQILLLAYKYIRKRHLRQNQRMLF